MRMKNETIQKLMSLVSDKTGLRLAGNDNAALQEAVLERMGIKKLSSPEQYLRLLESEADESAFELDALISPLMVGESYFFRDKGQFQLIRERILPELVELRKHDKTLNIWSAGCACGEEAYSLAITLSETVPDIDDWKICILGTDLKDDFLEKARGGVYGAWSFRAVPDGTIRKYFYERSGLFELIPRIRSMVVFLKGNLLHDSYPTPFGDLRDIDLILCRNVFIYYGRNAVAEMVKKMAGTLREGGYLITGHWELFSSPSDLLKPIMFPESIAYQRAHEVIKKWPTTVFKMAQQPQVLLDKKLDLSEAVFSPPISTPSKEEPHNQYLLAEEHFMSGDYMAAIKRLNAVLEGYPGHFKGLCLMANALANIGDHAKAEDNLKRAVRADPLSPEPHSLLARIAEETGDMDSAIESLRKVIYLEPSSVSAYLELAAIHENASEFEKAGKARKSAISILKTFPKGVVVEPYGEKVETMIVIVEKLLA